MDPYEESAAVRALSRYPYAVRSVRLLSDKGKKAVWYVDAEDAGGLILKKVPFGTEAIRFMIAAIDYMRGRGLGTPRVHRTSDGGGWAREDGQNYVLFDAVRGRPPEYKIEAELRTLLRGLATFHVASQGFESPTGFYPSYLLTDRETTMRRRVEQLAAWKSAAAGKPNPNGFDRLFLGRADAFVAQGEDALERLRRTGYGDWVRLTHETKTLCHQDFAAGNTAIGDDGRFYVFDMDSLTVDVPIRDLRKILNKVMKRDLAWDLDTMLTMMKAYHEAHPLTKDQYAALVAELTFPHLVYGQVSKYYEGREPSWTEEKHLQRLHEMILTESSKERVLESFLAGLDAWVR
ncbi:CotS family spore coat protein [Paenibacillus antri]|nr:CotS family spore coat protein [Paenibacillus antri]